MTTSISENSHRLYDVLVSPVVTEKATFLSTDNYYAFKVASWATKNDIKLAAQKIFKVDVEDVKTLNQQGKRKVFRGRKGVQSDFKKAFIRVKKGQNIDPSVGI